MASSPSPSVDLADFPQLLHSISKPLRPQTITDAVALAVTLLLFAAYALRSYTWDKPDPHHHIWFSKPQEDSSQTQKQKATRNIAQKLEESNKDCVIFWGSQSGTAETFAARLAKEAHLRFGLRTIAADLSDYDSETVALIPQRKLAIFILSTYGEGDPSDNATGLWDWITQGEKISLANLRYAAFGLGNSNYKYYNRVVDVVTEKLDAQGAQSLLPVGRADDAQRSTEEDFMSWKDDLFAVFRTSLQLQEQDVKYEPMLQAIEDESLDLIDLYQGEPVQHKVEGKQASKYSAIKSLTIKDSHELFTGAGNSRNCVHMELDLADHSDLTYKTGDHLAVWPTNPEAEVQRLLQATGLGSRADIPLLLKSLDPDVALKIPAPATISVIFRNYLEICAPVSRDTIFALAQFAPNADARATIVKLGQNREHYQEFTSHTQLTLGRLLLLASPSEAWKDLPPSWIIETLPVIQPRYYSISSSSVLSPRRVAITALVAADGLLPPPATTSQLHSTQPAKVHGVTTNYLLALSQQQKNTDGNHDKSTIQYNLPITETTHKLYAHIRKSNFKLPLSRSCPIIMVAAGTGLAPFRAFIAERAKLATSTASSSSSTAAGPVGRMLLFFGCRHPDQDYIYRHELEQIQAKLNNNNQQKQAGNELLSIVTAFSRTVDAGKKKVYVQDRVTEQAREVLRLLLEENANFYICGRTTMAKEVGKRVVEAVQQEKGWDEARAWEWLETLKRQRKWREDVWG